MLVDYTVNNTIFARGCVVKLLEKMTAMLRSDLVKFRALDDDK